MARSIVEQVTNCKIYDDGTILVQNVRFSYVHVDAAWQSAEQAAKGGTAKYSVVGMLPKKTHRAANEVIKAFIDTMLKDHKEKGMASKDKFLRDGNDHKNPEYDGHWTINTSEVNPPSVRGKNTRPIPQGKIKSEVKSGYWGDILIKPWFQKNVHGTKINAGFIAIQVKKEDEVFGDTGVSEEDIDETFDAAEEDGDHGFDDDGDDDYGGL